MYTKNRLRSLDTDESKISKLRIFMGNGNAPAPAFYLLYHELE